MTYEDAQLWLKGERSMTNIVPYDPLDWQARIARADAAMMEQAYWVVRAHKEDLIDYEREPTDLEDCREMGGA